ncbi:hypothetical protein GOODEAATRI_015111, partial [Goodea atripinnis]
LKILPESKVQSGTKVTIHCQVSVSFSNISHLEHLFKFLRDDVQIHTANTTEDSVDYEINPARVADSGNYGCLVLVKNKRKASNIKRLDVTGMQCFLFSIVWMSVHIGDCFLSCDYEINVIAGTSRSNSSNGIQVKVKGDYTK